MRYGYLGRFSTILLAAVLFAVAPAAPMRGQDFDSELPDLQFEEFNQEFDNGPPSPEAPPAGLMAGIFICAGLLALAAGALGIWIIYLFYNAQTAVPEQFRELQPWLVWLLLIPLVQVVILFMVGIMIPRSYRNYFNSVGRTDVGDCGESLGLWMAITALIPCVNLVSIVLMIMLLMKLYDLKKQIGQVKAT